MDRETPFTVDEVYWSHRIAGRDRQRQQMTVRLLLMPRARLAALLGALAAAGLRPKRAEIVGGPDEGCCLPLDTDGGQRHSEPRRRWLLWPAAALCAGLAVLMAVLPFVRQANALAEVNREIAADRPVAAEAEGLRREIDRLASAANVVESERDKAGRPLGTLATLTRLVPDDTYLTELQQQQRKMSVSGRSAAASRLIAALATGNELRDPAFAAPVTRAEGSRPEIFTITVEIGP
jgi:general secretion pathway protein L